MFYDIVFPKDNEIEFIKLAEKLDINGLCFAYPFTDKQAVNQIKKKSEDLQGQTKINLNPVFKSTDNFKNIYKIKDLNEVAICDARQNSREIIAKFIPAIVYNLELSDKNDFAKARNSGLDKAICQFAHKNKVIVAFSFSTVLTANDKPLLFGRMAQNIRLCRDYKINTAFSSFATKPLEMRSPRDLRALLSVLGMNTSSAKNSVESVHNLLVR